MFVAGDVETGLITDQFSRLQRPELIPTCALAVATLNQLGVFHLNQNAKFGISLAHWRQWGVFESTVSFQQAEQSIQVRVKKHAEVASFGSSSQAVWEMQFNGGDAPFTVNVQLNQIKTDWCKLEIDGVTQDVNFYIEPRSCEVFVAGERWLFRDEIVSLDDSPASANGNRVLAPMPGLVTLNRSEDWTDSGKR